MKKIQDLKDDIISGKLISKEEAITLETAPLDELCKAANEIREFFCGNDIDLCTIINGKSGRCTEDCKFCAQSSSYDTNVPEYPLLNKSKIVEQAKYNKDHGVLRYSIVSSGKNISKNETEKVCESIKEIKEQTNISVCASFGLLSKSQLEKLKSVGVIRIHNNLETSRRYFSNVCTTHTYDEKISVIKNAKKIGLNICSGGIMGIGENMEDRIDMALTLRELGVNSIPINMLNPIKGTPYENNKVLTNDEMCRIVAIFRFILPKSFIRLAGGRNLLPDKGRKCLLSGANAILTGDFLTTPGFSIQEDMEMIKSLGFEKVENL